MKSNVNTSHLEGSKTLTAVIFIYDSMNPGGTPYDGIYWGAPARKGYLFQASGIWKDGDFTSWSISKGREICHLGMWKGPKGLKDELYGFIKSRKHSIFVIDSYLKDSAFTAVKRDAKL